MSRKFLTGIDMVKTQIQNVLAHIVAGDAGTPVEGQFWYNSVSQRLRLRANAATLTLITDGGDLSTGSVANTALTTNPLLRSNHTGTQVAASISDLGTVVQAYRIDQFAAPNTAVGFGSQRLTSVADPTGAQDAATKNYVDTAVTGLAWKQAVRAASTGNLTLSGAQTIDGVAVVAGDRVLAKNQTTASQNGIYVVAAGAWTRATDSDVSAELVGSAVMVTEGSINDNTQWIMTTNAPITVNTTALTYVQFGGGASYTAGNGVTLSANAFSVVADTGILVSGTGVAINPAVVVRKYAQAVGDGSATSIVVTHSLGTQDVIVRVFLATGTFEEVECDIQHTSTTTVTLIFAVAPTAGQYRVVVHA